LNKVKKFCGDISITHRAWVLVYFAMLLMIVTLVKRFKDKVLMLLLQLYFIVMLLGIVFLIKPAERVHEPMLALSGFLLLFNFLHVEHANYSKQVLSLFSIIAAIVVLIIVIHVYKWFYSRDLYDSETEEFHSEVLSDIYSKMTREKKIVIFTAPAFELFRMRPFREFRASEDNPIWTYDTHMTYLPGYDEQLKKLTGSAAFTDFYTVLANYGQRALIVSNNERIHFISDYSLLLHNFRIEYESCPDSLLSDSERNTEKLRFYYIKSVCREDS
jgi:hypothetical protein